MSGWNNTSRLGRLKNRVRNWPLEGEEESGALKRKRDEEGEEEEEETWLEKIWSHP